MTTSYTQYGYGPDDGRYPTIVGFETYEQTIETARKWVRRKLQSDREQGQVRVAIYVPGADHDAAFAGYVTAYTGQGGEVCVT